MMLGTAGKKCLGRSFLCICKEVAVLQSGIHKWKLVRPSWLGQFGHVLSGVVHRCKLGTSWCFSSVNCGQVVCTLMQVVHCMLLRFSQALEDVLHTDCVSCLSCLLLGLLPCWFLSLELPFFKRKQNLLWPLGSCNGPLRRKR